MKGTSVAIPPELREEIEKYRILRKHEKLSQAARALIRIGLDTEMKEL